MKSIEIENDSRALERLEKSAERIRKATPKFTKEQAFVRAVETNPDDALAYSRHQARGWGYDPAEYVRKAEDAAAVLDRAARPYMESDPRLTKEQAIVKALKTNPDLYEEASA